MSNISTIPPTFSKKLPNTSQTFTQQKLLPLTNPLKHSSSPMSSPKHFPQRSFPQQFPHNFPPTYPLSMTSPPSQTILWPAYLRKENSSSQFKLGYIIVSPVSGLHPHVAKTYVVLFYRDKANTTREFSQYLGNSTPIMARLHIYLFHNFFGYFKSLKLNNEWIP